MDSLFDIIKDKAEELQDSVRGDIALAQQEVSRLFPKHVTVTKIDGEVIFIQTKSSPLASEIRLRQVELLDILNNCLKNRVEQIRIQIR